MFIIITLSNNHYSLRRDGKTQKCFFATILIAIACNCLSQTNTKEYSRDRNIYFPYCNEDKLLTAKLDSLLNHGATPVCLFYWLDDRPNWESDINDIYGKNVGAKIISKDSTNAVFVENTPRYLYIYSQTDSLYLPIVLDWVINPNPTIFKSVHFE